MDEMKKIDNETLEKVDGGTASAFAELREEFKKMIPAEVQEKASVAVGDEAVRKILAENGIDVEKIDKKIARAGFGQAKIGLQELPDEALDKIVEWSDVYLNGGNVLEISMKQINEFIEAK